MQKTGDNVQVTTYAWTEWLPDHAITWPEVNFAPGDVIEVRVYSDVNTPLEGTVTTDRFIQKTPTGNSRGNLWSGLWRR